MLLEIDDWRTVGDLQYRFNKCFPNLTLRVFDALDFTRKRAPLPSSIRLEKVRNVHQSGVLHIKSWFTCSQVAHLLEEQYGLNVLVVREDGRMLKSGKYTLQELNNLPSAGNVEKTASIEEPEPIEGWSTSWS